MPFKQGEEVLIQSRSRMYNIDDAIAKIDGYMISIAGGRAVRGREQADQDREVKRTAAYARIVTNGIPSAGALGR